MRQMRGLQMLVLDATKFVRVHRTHIVNLDHVSTFKGRSGKFVAVMDDGREVGVSRERAKELRILGL